MNTKNINTKNNMLRGFLGCIGSLPLAFCGVWTKIEIERSGVDDFKNFYLRKW